MLSSKALLVFALSCSGSLALKKKKEPLYHELLRPQFHYTPEKNWMNDPNGLIFHRGKYHLYYQHNPSGIDFGDISWGHASSFDLNRWTQHPVAIGREVDAKGNTAISPYSGSVVYDVANSARLKDKGGRTPLIALYTAAYEQDTVSADDRKIPAGTQAQSLAYSLDDGFTWAKYDNNPVIAKPPMKYSNQSTSFRDPQVFWYPPTSNGKPDPSRPGHWAMVVALPDLHKVLFYKSPDLINWEWVSELGPLNAIGGPWETPNLFPVLREKTTLVQSWIDWFTAKKPALKWVLTIGMNTGGPTPGSGTQYFIGDFDGTYFNPDDDTLVKRNTTDSDEQGKDAAAEGSAAKSTKTSEPAATATEETTATVIREDHDGNWLDYGPDFYAFATFNGLPNYERTGLAWMNNWNYSKDMPTEPWRGVMTLPREISLQNHNGKLRLIQQPVGLKVDKEILYTEYFESAGVGDPILELAGKHLDITMEFNSTSTAKRFGLYTRLIRSANMGTLIGYDFNSSQMLLDRTNSQLGRFSTTFKRFFYAPLDPSPDGMIRIRAILDTTSVEMFGGDGEAAITAQIFAHEGATQVTLAVIGGELHNLTITAREIPGIWGPNPIVKEELKFEL